MAVLIGNGYLVYGGSVLESSGGVKLACFCESNTKVVLYSDIDSSPSLEDSDLASTIFSSGDGVTVCKAAIDSSDNVHIIVGGAAPSSSYHYAYCIATYTAGSWVFGSWESVWSLSEIVLSNRWCEISLDSNDKPHILIVDAVKMTGATGDNVYYMEKTGASWSTPEQVGVRATKTHEYDQPTLTLRNNDYIEAVYYFAVGSNNPAIRTNDGSWGSESVYSGGGVPNYYGFGVVSSTGGTVSRVTTTSSYDIEINDVDTGYNHQSTYGRLHIVLIGTDLYIFYIDSNYDVHLLSNTGSGWSDEGYLNAGTFHYAIPNWSYQNFNTVDEIIYIFQNNSQQVYFDVFTLGAAVSNVPVPICTTQLRKQRSTLLRR